jgi:dGTPase
MTAKPTAPKLVELADGSWVREDLFEVRYARMSGPPDTEPSDDPRTESEKDRGRVSYSPFLRRLAGVSQVTTPSLLSPRLHTRESHSHKVSLVAREVAEGIARKIKKEPTGDFAIAVREMGGLDVTAAETAGLAHDLGHPPFGHAGEVALNRLLRENGVRDGFEGNPQSFRIVTLLDRQRRFGAEKSRLGQELTLVSLAAILKYPRLCPPDRLVGGANEEKARQRPPKFGSYLENGSDTNPVFEEAAALMRTDDDGIRRQTLEASIMDLADDVSYATHDLEDFYKEGRIDFSKVLIDLQDAHRKLTADENADAESNEFIRTAHVLRDDYGNYFNLKAYLKEILNISNSVTTGDLTFEYTGSLTQGSKLVGVTSGFIERMFEDIHVSVDPPWPNGPGVYLKKPAWHLMQCLKTITKRYVVGTARMATIERAQAAAVENLFRGLSTWVVKEPWSSQKFPEPLASYLDDLTDKNSLQLRYRAIGDYIAGLSDQECLARARWMAGVEIPIMGAAQ